MDKNLLHCPKGTYSADDPAETAAVSYEEWLPTVYKRLRCFTGKLLQNFPTIRPWTEGEDILHAVLLRMQRKIQAVRPCSDSELFTLVCRKIRWELLNLARHNAGAKWQYTHAPASRCPIDLSEIPDPAEGSEDLEEWSSIHETIMHLPSLEREVVVLRLYSDWTEDKIAELFHVTVRTVRRRWRSAILNVRKCVST